MDNLFASSSMLSCSGVRFSSTWAEVRTSGSTDKLRTHILHHGEDDTELSLRASGDNDARAAAVADEGTHVSDAWPLRECCIRSSECVGRLCDCTRLAREAALVNLQVDGVKQADVSWDAVADRKVDNVARNELVGQKMCRKTVAQEMAVMRHQLVKCLKRLLASTFLYKPDCEMVSTLGLSICGAAGIEASLSVTRSNKRTIEACVPGPQLR